MTRHVTVETLLAELFHADELRRFLMKLEGGSDLLDELPGREVSSAAFSHEVARLLDRRGEIGPEFFSLLERERPRKKRRIREFSVAYLAGGRQAQSSSDSRGGVLSAMRVKLCVVLIFVGGLSVFSVNKILALSARSGAVTKIDACNILCRGCPGVSRAWVFLPTGEELVVETDGNKLIFKCLPRGTHVVVFLEVLGGAATVDVMSTSIVLDADMTQLEVEELVSGSPDGFAIVDGVPRYKPVAGHRAPRGGGGDLQAQIVSETSDGEEIILCPDGERVAPSDLPSAAEVQSPEFKGAEVDCRAIRRDTIAARERAAWKKVMQLTGHACWRDYPQGLELRVHALKEFGDFKNCAKLGAGSKDAKVQRYVDFCQKP